MDIAYMFKGCVWTYLDKRDKSVYMNDAKIKRYVMKRNHDNKLTQYDPSENEYYSNISS